jgi:hypothetical protein
MPQELNWDRQDATDTSSDAPRRMDAAVRAALKSRPHERRSFRNEDDMEGPRIDSGQRRKAGGEDPQPS